MVLPVHDSPSAEDIHGDFDEARLTDGSSASSCRDSRGRPPIQLKRKAR